MNRPTTAPPALRKLTNFRGINQDILAENTANKLEIVQEDQQAVSKLLNHKLDQNKFIIQKLSGENKEIMTFLKASGKNFGLPPVPKGDQQLQLSVIKGPTLSILSAQIKDMELNLDKYTHKKRLNFGKIKQLDDNINLLTKEIDRPEPVVERALKQVRDLENQLDDASIKEKEAYSIQDTFKTIINKLKRESLRFEKELEFSDTQSKIQEQDIAQLTIYTKEAEDAAVLTQAQCESYRGQLSQQKQTRKQALDERRHEVELIIEQERAAEKLKQESQLIDYHKNINYEEEDFDVEKCILNEQFMQKQLTKIRDLAGIDDLDQLVKKSVNQAKVQEELQENTKESQDKLSEISKEVSGLKIQLQDASFAADSMGNRRLIDRLKQQIQEERFRVSAVQLHSQQAGVYFNQLQRGIHHILELLIIIQTVSDLDIQSLSTSNTEDLKPRIQCISEKICALMEVVDQQQIAASSMRVSRVTNCVEVNLEEDAIDLVQDDWDGSGLTVGKSSAVSVESFIQPVQKDENEFDKVRREQKERTRKIIESQKKEEY
ncbi:hypothetical protein SS50377_26776 [Spironucleus salmonicida]|uniref:Uncharacterized protein n=1 Tax=Spironucleus salmonicida TaxID=348837 RepID=V6LXH2_9EUKA|nr:hypothetical protein SS50377_26776 [Spironucleus salmonicida]|eukprot:EST49245.1 Hypothetical protein SS50377_10465 [Spironucleus salmonicida]